VPQAIKKLPINQQILHYESDYQQFLNIYRLQNDMYVNVHDVMEIVYLYSGELHLYADDVLYVLHGGEAIILNSGCIHYALTSEDTVTEYDAILVDWKQLCLLADDAENDIYKKLAERKVRFVTCILREDHNAELLCEIRRIISGADACAPGWKLQVISAYYSIAAICMRTGLIENMPLYDGEKNELWKNDMALYIAFTKYVDSYFRTAMTVADIAAALHISESKLYKVCKWVNDCPPVEYIARRRLAIAARYLHSTELSVTEICYACGFRNLSYFIAEFRKVYGETPHKYRLSHTEK
jgi:AraC-like DNA-binding protein